MSFACTVHAGYVFNLSKCWIVRAAIALRSGVAETAVIVFVAGVCVEMAAAIPRLLKEGAWGVAGFRF